jgi:hypothetical protein
MCNLVRSDLYTRGVLGKPIIFNKLKILPRLESGQLLFLGSAQARSLRGMLFSKSDLPSCFMQSKVLASAPIWKQAWQQCVEKFLHGLVFDQKNNTRHLQKILQHALLPQIARLIALSNQSARIGGITSPANLGEAITLL